MDRPQNLSFEEIKQEIDRLHSEPDKWWKRKDVERAVLYARSLNPPLSWRNIAKVVIGMGVKKNIRTVYDVLETHYGE